MYYQLKKIHPYKKIALNFFFFVLILLALVGYFIFYHADIYITPIKERISAEFPLIINPQAKSAQGNVLPGRIQSVVLEKKAVFSATGEKKVAQKGVVGKVTIYNTTSVDQPLVATTRLLTPDHILFRIKKGVIVPAKGKVTVEVYTNDKKFTGFLAPTKMTIPGLSPYLQKLIYARNQKPLQSTKEVTVVSADDFNAAQEKLEQEMIAEAKKQFLLAGRNQINFNLLGKIPKIRKVDWVKVISSQSDKKIGDQAKEFTLDLKVKVVEISFDENKVISLARKKVLAIVPDDKQFLSLDTDNLNYSVQSCQNNQAKLLVTAYGEMIISPHSRALAKSKLAGMSLAAAQKYLENIPSVKSVRIEIPFHWLNHLPRNPSRISLHIGY